MGRSKTSSLDSNFVGIFIGIVMNWASPLHLNVLFQLKITVTESE